MKNKKGFTLVEIIGVIVIIGIIALVAVPSFISSLNVFREDYYENVVKTLENSGQEFFTDNKIYRPSKIFEARYVNLSTLEMEKYISNIEDYEGNNCNNDSYVIIVRRGKNDYEYAVCLKCEADDFSTTENKYCDPAWLDSTKIGYGLGEIPTIYVYKGTKREEVKEKLKVAAWIIKYNNAGEEIDRVDGSGIEEVPEIYPTNLDTVDTNTPGEYTVTYEFNDKTEEGKVVVYENSAPSIIIKKENIVKSGNATQSESATQVTNYISGEWGQKVIITLSATDNNYNHSETNVTKFQWKIDNKWLDLCESSDGRTCTATITDEMNEEGIHFRAVDNEGNISLVTDDPMTIRIDNTRPTCELSKTGNLGDNSWYVGDVTVTFNSSKTKDIVKDTPEAVSGISKKIVTVREISGSDTAVQVVDTTGITWYGYVEDRAQNYTICEINFKKDATDPVCELNLDGTVGDNSWYITNVGISFSKNLDVTSGVADYGIGSLVASNTATHTVDTASQTYIGYIKDNAGNTGECTVNFKKDSTKPECGLKLDGTVGDNSWYVSDVGISFNKNTDAMSGVADYGIGSVSGNETATHSTDTTGQTYTGYIKDNAGNENTCTKNVKRDVTNPVCELALDGTVGENGWYRSNVEVSFSKNTDATSGVADYGIGSVSGNETATQTADTASNTYIGYIKDNAGNTSDCSKSLKKDATAPTCTNSGDNTTWTNSSITINYGCSDSLSQCNSSFSGGSSVFSTTTKVSTIAKYTIKDKAGNITECDARNADVYVDTTDPTCTISVTSGTEGDNGWYKSSSVTVSSSFGDSGGSGLSGKGTTTSSSTSYNGETSYTISSNTSGTTVNCYAKDSAGNTGSNSITIMKDDGGSSGCTATGVDTWRNTTSSVTISFTSPPISGCQSHSMTGSSLAPNCSHSYQVSTDSGTVKKTTTAENYVTTKSGATISCSVANVNVLLDKEAPTISCEVSNRGTESGVTVECDCGDGSGSGVASCPGTDTGVTSSTTYTVTDNAGNTASETISVTSTTQTRYRTRTWNNCKTGSSSACVGGYKTCATASCGTYSCSCTYYCQYYCTPTLSSCGISSGKFKDYDTWNYANLSCSGVQSQLSDPNCGYSCDTEVITSCSTCNNTCQHKDCGWDSCLTTQNTCEGGWNDYGSWSAWSTTSCTEDNYTDCETRTIYG